MRSALLASFSLFIVGCSSIQTKPSTDSAPNEVEFLKRFEQVWNQHDVTAFADLFTENATWISVVGGYWKGKGTIAEQSFQLFQGSPNNNQLLIENISSEKIEKDTILIVADWQLKKRVQRYGISYARKRNGILSLVLAKDQKGYWKVSFAQGTLKFQPLQQPSDHE
jgi:uncharacterized protein (TIGR02246 family)